MSEKTLHDYHLTIIKSDDSLGPIYRTSESEIRIGGRADCDIRLKLEIVEAVHCKITTGPQGRVRVENQSEERPIELNGVPILKATYLKHLDIINVCGKRFQWFNDNAGKVTPIGKSSSQPEVTAGVYDGGAVVPTAVAAAAAAAAPATDTKVKSTLSSFDGEIGEAIKRRITMHETVASDETISDKEQIDEEEGDRVTPEPQPDPETPKKATSYQTPVQNKENATPQSPALATVANSLNHSGTLIVYFSPNKRNLPQTPKSAGHVFHSARNTPSVYGTPKSVLSEVNESTLTAGGADGSALFSPNTTLMRSSMHLIDLATPAAVERKRGTTVDLNSPAAVTKSPRVGSSALLRSAIKNSTAKTPTRAAGVASGLKQPIRSPKPGPSTAFGKGVSPVVRGVKRLMLTPKRDESGIVTSTKRVIKTPTTSKEPKNELDNMVGVKELLKTPHPAAKDGLDNMVGVKELLKTPYPAAKDELDMVGVKELLKTPHPTANPNVQGVRQLFQTPKADRTVNLSGLNELMASPISERNEEEEDEEAEAEVLQEVDAPKLTSEPLDMDNATTEEVFDALAGKPHIKHTYTGKSPGKRSTSPEITDNSPTKGMRHADIESWVVSVVKSSEHITLQPNPTTQVIVNRFSNVTPNTSILDTSHSHPMLALSPMCKIDVVHDKTVESVEETHLTAVGSSLRSTRKRIGTALTSLNSSSFRGDGEEMNESLGLGMEPELTQTEDAADGPEEEQLEYVTLGVADEEQAANSVSISEASEAGSEISFSELSIDRTPTRRDLLEGPKTTGKKGAKTPKKLVQSTPKPKTAMAEEQDEMQLGTAPLDTTFEIMEKSPEKVQIDEQKEIEVPKKAKIDKFLEAVQQMVGQKESVEAKMDEMLPETTPSDDPVLTKTSEKAQLTESPGEEASKEHKENQNISVVVDDNKLDETSPSVSTKPSVKTPKMTIPIVSIEPLTPEIIAEMSKEKIQEDETMEVNEAARVVEKSPERLNEDVSTPMTKDTGTKTPKKIQLGDQKPDEELQLPIKSPISSKKVAKTPKKLQPSQENLDRPLQELETLHEDAKLDESYKVVAEIVEKTPEPMPLEPVKSPEKIDSLSEQDVAIEGSQVPPEPEIRDNEPDEASQTEEKGTESSPKRPIVDISTPVVKKKVTKTPKKVQAEVPNTPKTPGRTRGRRAFDVASVEKTQLVEVKDTTEATSKPMESSYIIPSTPESTKIATKTPKKAPLNEDESSQTPEQTVPSFVEINTAPTESLQTVEIDDSNIDIPDTSISAKNPSDPSQENLDLALDGSETLQEDAKLDESHTAEAQMSLLSSETDSMEKTAESTTLEPINVKSAEKIDSQPDQDVAIEGSPAPPEPEISDKDPEEASQIEEKGTESSSKRSIVDLSTPVVKKKVTKTPKKAQTEVPNTPKTPGRTRGRRAIEVASVEKTQLVEEKNATEATSNFPDSSFLVPSTPVSTKKATKTPKKALLSEVEPLQTPERESIPVVEIDDSIIDIPDTPIPAKKLPKKLPLPPSMDITPESFITPTRTRRGAKTPIDSGFNVSTTSTSTQKTAPIPLETTPEARVVIKTPQSRRGRSKKVNISPEVIPSPNLETPKRLIGDVEGTPTSPPQQDDVQLEETKTLPLTRDDDTSSPAKNVAITPKKIQPSQENLDLPLQGLETLQEDAKLDESHTAEAQMSQLSSETDSMEKTAESTTLESINVKSPEKIDSQPDQDVAIEGSQVPPETEISDKDPEEASQTEEKAIESSPKRSFVDLSTPVVKRKVTKTPKKVQTDVPNTPKTPGRTRGRRAVEMTSVEKTQLVEVKDTTEASSKSPERPFAVLSASSSTKKAAKTLKKALQQEDDQLQNQQRESLPFVEIEDSIIDIPDTPIPAKKPSGPSQDNLDLSLQGSETLQEDAKLDESHTVEAQMSLLSSEIDSMEKTSEPMTLESINVKSPEKIDSLKDQGVAIEGSPAPLETESNDKDPEEASQIEEKGTESSPKRSIVDLSTPVVNRRVTKTPKKAQTEVPNTPKTPGRTRGRRAIEVASVEKTQLVEEKDTTEATSNFPDSSFVVPSTPVSTKKATKTPKKALLSEVEPLQTPERESIPVVEIDDSIIDIPDTPILAKKIPLPPSMETTPQSTTPLTRTRRGAKTPIDSGFNVSTTSTSTQKTVTLPFETTPEARVVIETPQSRRGRSKKVNISPEVIPSPNLETPKRLIGDVEGTPTSTPQQDEVFKTPRSTRKTRAIEQINMTPQQEEKVANDAGTSRASSVPAEAIQETPQKSTVEEGLIEGEVELVSENEAYTVGRSSAVARLSTIVKDFARSRGLESSNEEEATEQNDTSLFHGFSEAECLSSPIKKPASTKKDESILTNSKLTVEAEMESSVNEEEIPSTSKMATDSDIEKIANLMNESESSEQELTSPKLSTSKHVNFVNTPKVHEVSIIQSARPTRKAKENAKALSLFESPLVEEKSVTKRARGAAKKVQPKTSESESDQITTETESETPVEGPKPKKRGRTVKKDIQLETSSAEEVEVPAEKEIPKKRGRQTKKESEEASMKRGRTANKPKDDAEAEFATKNPPKRGRAAKTMEPKAEQYVPEVVPEPENPIDEEKPKKRGRAAKKLELTDEEKPEKSGTEKVSETNASIVEQIPKKRGRIAKKLELTEEEKPEQYVPEAVSEPENPIDEEKPKKRGRARKKTDLTDKEKPATSSSEKISEMNASSVEEMPKKRGRVRKQTQLTDEENPEQFVPEAVLQPENPIDEEKPKKRGRARKQTELTDEENPEQFVPDAVLEKRGRARKKTELTDEEKPATSSSEKISATNASSVEEIPKKRGRARKQTELTDEEKPATSSSEKTSETNASNLEEMPKKRGRAPKKTESEIQEASEAAKKSSEQLASTSEEPQKAPSKRGRSKKDTQSETIEKDDVFESPKPVKMGTRRKKAETDDKLVSTEKPATPASVTLPNDSKLNHQSPAEAKPKPKRGRPVLYNIIGDAPAVPIQNTSTPELAKRGRRPRLAQTPVDSPIPIEESKSAKIPRRGRKRTAEEPDETNKSTTLSEPTLMPAVRGRRGKESPAAAAETSKTMRGRGRTAKSTPQGDSSRGSKRRSIEAELDEAQPNTTKRAKKTQNQAPKNEEPSTSASTSNSSPAFAAPLPNVRTRRAARHNN